jgi:hypothetical protein
VTSRPQKKVIRIIGQAIPAMMDSVVREPIAAIDQAIQASDSARFTAAYEQLTVACNTTAARIAV